MLGGLKNLLLYRVLGGRIMLALAVVGFVRRLVGGRRSDPSRSQQLPPPDSRRPR